MPLTRVNRRQEILDAAASVIASCGYVGTSLKDIADACGIQAGSLYHHFASKEAIAVELVARYQAEMARVGDEALRTLAGPDGQPGAVSPRQQVVDLCTAIAECAHRHRAALQLTSYEAPAGAGQRYAELLRAQPPANLPVLAAVLQRAKTGGALHPAIDVELFAAQLCDSMRHAGLGIFYPDEDPREVAALLCRLVLDGGPACPVSDAELDRSPARAAADAAIRGWATRDRTSPKDKTALLLAAARSEFARRGYEATTVREIAAAARMRSGNVYRFIESKDAMLASIMGAYHNTLSAGYRAVLASDSTAVAQLDALTWLNINILESFPEEFAIQQAWMRTIPPAVSDLSAHQRDRARQIRQVVTEGLRSGELRPGPARQTDLLAMCYRDLAWPSALVPLAGPERTLAHCRSTLMRAAARS